MCHGGRSIRCRYRRAQLPQVFVDWNPSLIELTVTENHANDCSANAPSQEPGDALSVTTVRQDDLARLVTQKHLGNHVEGA